MTTIYQTINDTQSPDKIEQNGPILCENKNAWLGRGYYFWESFIQNAHWWGSVHNNNSYIICQSCYEKDETCFDLIDNPTHLQLLQDIIEEMKRQGLFKPQTTVARVIEYLRKINIFDYCSTRAYAIGCKSERSPYFNTIRFQNGNLAYLDLNPPYQICFYTKKALKSEYKIIYPEIYLEGYGI